MIKWDLSNQLKSLQSNDSRGFEPSREELLDHHNLFAGVEHGLDHHNLGAGVEHGLDHHNLGAGLSTGSKPQERTMKLEPLLVAADKVQTY